MNDYRILLDFGASPPRRYHHMNWPIMSVLYSGLELVLMRQGRRRLNLNLRVNRHSTSFRLLADRNSNKLLTTWNREGRTDPAPSECPHHLSALIRSGFHMRLTISLTVSILDRRCHCSLNGRLSFQQQLIHDFFNDYCWSLWFSHLIFRQSLVVLLRFGVHPSIEPVSFQPQNLQLHFRRNH